MASPQVEDGYTKIANEVFDALGRIRIPGEARQALDFIIRKTWGWNKKSDHIPLGQFCEGTGMKKPKVCRAIEKLEAMNLITKKGNAHATEYSFNKDFDTWKLLPKKGIFPIMGMDVPHNGNKKFPLLGHSKETLSKETITKEKEMIARAESIPPGFEEFWKIYPKKIAKAKAQRLYSVKLKSGVTQETLLKAAGNYAEVLKVNVTPYHYILHPSTFLGPDSRYEDYLDDEQVKKMMKPRKDINEARGVGKPEDFEGGIKKL